ncbi:MAG: hypothetical protein ACR2KN_06185 [Geodermatophilaceae bacterium]
MVNRRGRRDNGLDAASFVPLRDVDPRVGEHLLDVLRNAGIAAYLEPTSDTDSYTRAVSLPSPPSDRLWVDRRSRPDAQSLVTEHADDDVRARREPTRPERTDSPSAPRDEAAIWAQIVANYERIVDAPVPPWPVREDADDGVSRQRERAETPGPLTARDLDLDHPSSAAEDSEEDSRPAPDDPEDHYRPPPPPPVPRLQAATLYALVSIAVGAMLLVAPGVLDLGSDASFVLGVFGIVIGVAMLVYRMRERPPYDGGPDDGAVV